MPAADAASQSSALPSAPVADTCAGLAPDDLRCPHCDYRVYGLTQPRCPECGQAFAWDDLRAAALSDTDLLEHRLYRQPLRALLRTWYRAAFWPERIWQYLRPINRPRVIPLLIFAALQTLVFAVGWDAMARAVDPLMNLLGNWMRGALRVRAWHFTYFPRTDFFFLQEMAVWHVCTFGVTLAVCRFASPTGRWPHVLRVYVHATAFVALCPAIWCLFEAVLDASLFFRPLPPNWPPRHIVHPVVYDHLGQGMFIAGLLVTWLHLARAFRSYLHIRPAWAAAAIALFAGHVLADVTLTLTLLY